MAHSAFQPIPFTSTRWLTLARLTGLSAILTLAACSSSDSPTTYPANLVTRNDFEALAGWGVASPSLTTAQAHSGHYSVKVDKDIEYSLGYHNQLSQVSPARINKLHIKAWVLLGTPDAKAVVVLQVTDPAKPGPPVYWQALDVQEQVKTINHWTLVDKDFVLPATVAGTQELAVYLWRTQPSATVYLDDLEITKE